MAELDDALRGRFENWRGLPPIGERDLRHILEPLEETEGPHEDVRLTTRFLVFTYRRPQPPRIVEAWFPAGAAEAALIEFDDPSVPDAAALLALYGPPEMVLTNRRAHEGATVDERVYASRGVTLSVARRVTGGPLDIPVEIVHVQLYAARTTTQYLTQIGSVPPPRPYPRRRP